ncbi:hypothetical protein GO988_01450 [Hymenobacter sp. HMF4947]|uniref:Uncharacterized protein n=1 Tax=Hymenobacter ginkgonis TaxID=2682976 RepID=A0A7K1T997_9BACT|nr:hypothetical protein [Hymenobacter ginkgonis]MVN74984.1 hypothetical protein [Hymenobacter ginkgonis]
MNFRVLFLLQSSALTILEIQRLDLPATAPKGELYRWLRYEATNETLTALDFVHMHSAPPQEERQFRQGTLAFSAETGTFQPAEDPAAVYTLTLTPSLELPPSLAAQVAKFLAA